MSFTRAVHQSCKLKPCSQLATRNEKVSVHIQSCKCVCTCVKTLPSHQGLHLVAEGVESLGGNLSGNVSKLEVFSSFSFLFQSPPQLSVFCHVFFPLWRRILLLTGTRLNYRSQLWLLWNQQLHGSIWP